MKKYTLARQLQQAGDPRLTWRSRASKAARLLQNKIPQHICYLFNDSRVLYRSLARSIGLSLFTSIPKGISYSKEGVIVFIK